VSHNGTRDFEAQVQRKAEAHLDECFEALYEGDDTGTFENDSPAFAPFCGCTTCIVREVLMSVWDDLVDEIKGVDRDRHHPVFCVRCGQPYGEGAHGPGFCSNAPAK
jgi:hypothetical protein